jgi:hypothetical protein
MIPAALVQKFKWLQWVVIGLEIYTQDFVHCENFAPEPLMASNCFVTHQGVLNSTSAKKLLPLLVFGNVPAGVE